jgi:hypothetical protein
MTNVVKDYLLSSEVYIVSHLGMNYQEYTREKAAKQNAKIYHPGSVHQDKRFIFAEEHTGHEHPQVVVRFCGEAIAFCNTWYNAVTEAQLWNARRLGHD